MAKKWQSTSIILAACWQVKHEKRSNLGSTLIWTWVLPIDKCYYHHYTSNTIVLNKKKEL